MLMHGTGADNDTAPIGTTRISDLVYIAAGLSGVADTDITGPKRFRHIVMVRQAVMLVAFEQRAISYPQIGQRLGGRDHSTVVHGVKAARERAKRNPEYARFIDRLRFDAANAAPFVAMQRPRFVFEQAKPAPAPYTPPVNRRVVPKQWGCDGLKPVLDRGLDMDDGGVKFHRGMANGSAALLAALNLARGAA